MKKRSLTTLLHGIPYFHAFIAVLTFNSVIILIILVAQSLLPPEIPLFFNKPYGDKQLASKLYLTIPALISLFISSINLIIISKSTNKFLQQTLLGTSVTITTLSSITILKIFLLVANL